MAGDSSSTALDIITAFEALDTKKARRTAYETEIHNFERFPTDHLSDIMESWIYLTLMSGAKSRNAQSQSPSSVISWVHFQWNLSLAYASCLG